MTHARFAGSFPSSASTSVRTTRCAFGWRTLDDGRRQSQLRARVLLRELLAVGYREPVLLTAKSTLTGDVIAALTGQYAVLDAVDAFRAADKKPPLSPPFYACSIPLGPGQEVARGSGGQTKQITPPIACMPSPIIKDYVRAHWIRRDWAALIEGMLDDTIRWSVVTSQQLGVGDEDATLADLGLDAGHRLVEAARRIEQCGGDFVEHSDRVQRRDVARALDVVLVVVEQHAHRLGDTQALLLLGAQDDR
jgi:hypothetical protein